MLEKESPLQALGRRPSLHAFLLDPNPLAACTCSRLLSLQLQWLTQSNCCAARLLAGVPETPTIDTSSGGLSSATITWSASPTTAYYMVELLDKGVVKKSARVKSRWVLALEERRQQHHQSARPHKARSCSGLCGSK